MFKKLNILKLVLIFSIIYLSAGNVLYAKEFPTLDFLKASLKNQEYLTYPALKVKWKVTILTDGKQGTSEIISQYIRTPDYFFLEDRHFKNTELKFIYREKYERNSGVRKELSISKRGTKFGKIAMGLGPILGGRKLETTYFTIFLEGAAIPLYEALNKAAITRETKVIDGHKCWLIKIGESKNYYNVWLGQDIGFCPVLIEKFSDTKLVDKIHLYEYKEVINDFWFPMKMISEGLTSKGSITNVYQVTEISAGKPVSEEEAKLEFQPGTEVTDKLTGKLFKIPEK